MALLQSLLDAIGYTTAESDQDLFDDDMELEEPEDEKLRSLNSHRSKKQAPTSNVVPLPTSAKMKVIIYHPISYEDTQSIIDNLKGRKPVIVNMEDLEISCAQRIVDFMSGAVYALDGTIRKIARGIFVVVPTNYDLVGDDEDSANAEY